MLRMDQVHVIRHKVLVEGRSIRKTAKDLGVSRNTVRRYLKLSEPIRKEDVLEAARVVRGLATSAPVACGEVVLSGLLGEEGVDVVACRTMERV